VSFLRRPFEPSPLPCAPESPSYCDETKARILGALTACASLPASYTKPSFSHDPPRTKAVGATTQQQPGQSIVTPLGESCRLYLRGHHLPCPAMATTPSAPGTASYADCVSSLRSSLNFLESSVETLDGGVSDFPRLIKALKTVRVRAISCCCSICYALFAGSNP
jgi:hypothetical protein